MAKKQHLHSTLTPLKIYAKLLESGMNEGRQVTNLSAKVGTIFSFAKYFCKKNRFSCVFLSSTDTK
jgi:hypothetical protein